MELYGFKLIQSIAAHHTASHRNMFRQVRACSCWSRASYDWHSFVWSCFCVVVGELRRLEVLFINIFLHFLPYFKKENFFLLMVGLNVNITYVWFSKLLLLLLYFIYFFSASFLQRMNKYFQIWTWCGRAGGQSVE